MHGILQRRFGGIAQTIARHPHHKHIAQALIKDNFHGDAGITAAQDGLLFENL